jgi:arginyl-tRNA synthetase
MKEEIVQLIQRSIQTLQESGRFPFFDISERVAEVTRPKNDSFGDYTTNSALVLAKFVRKSPLEIAQTLRQQLLLCAKKYDKESLIATIEVVGGYINITLSEKVFGDAVARILREQHAFGNNTIGKGKRVNNEFISANPTGPLHLGNGRGGFFGDSLGKILQKSGFEVVNEYYVNDAGEQVMKLGHSVLKDNQAVYGGAYIDALHEQFGKAMGTAREVGEQSADFILREFIQKSVQEKMQVHFDVWRSEKALVSEGCVDRALTLLQTKEYTFEQDGALWFRSTAFGDDKDRVLMKSNGEKTYFASDCGYLVDKLSRGFDILTEVWGADHHGYITRFRAAAEALGFTGEVKFLMVQLVKVLKDGKEVRMSKRAGNVVLIDELLDRVGHDVTRFFFLMYAPDTHLNFDLGLAEERSHKNPVFSVQYAHARIASILTKARKEVALVYERALNEDGALCGYTPNAKEIALIRVLMQFPELIQESARQYEVHKLPHYALRLADYFHSFYNDCKVVDTTNEEATAFRLRLSLATKIVLAETLRLIGVSAPEKM